MDKYRTRGRGVQETGFLKPGTADVLIDSESCGFYKVAYERETRKSTVDLTSYTSMNRVAIHMVVMLYRYR
jgi:hypothetical protein